MGGPGMKYCSEEESKELRIAFEDLICGNLGVRKKLMFGCPAYFADDNLFSICGEWRNRAQ
jgi:hypothetical protein